MEITFGETVITLGAGASLTFLTILCGIPIVLVVWLYRKSGKLQSNDLDVSAPLSGPAEQTSTISPARKKPSTASRYLIFSLFSLLLLPCNFIFTLGAGMSGDAGEFMTILIIIGFLVHVAITIIFAAIGMVIRSASALEKYADSQQPDENTQ